MLCRRLACHQKAGACSHARPPTPEDQLARFVMNAPMWTVRFWMERRERRYGGDVDCRRGYDSTGSPASLRSVNRNVAPGPVFAIAHNRPPCDSTIDRLMARPIP